MSKTSDFLIRYGQTLLPIISFKFFLNSRIIPPQITTSGSASINAACFAKRSGTDISSLSILAIYSQEHSCTPFARALPNPSFWARATILTGAFPENSAITWSNSAVSGPSFTITISFGFRVCSSQILFNATSNSCGLSRK